MIVVDVFEITDDSEFERIGTVEPDGTIIEQSSGTSIDIVADDLSDRPVDEVVSLHNGPSLIARKRDADESDLPKSDGPTVIDLND